MDKSNRFHLTRSALYLLISSFFGFAFYIRYWKHRDCINEALSSCITADGNNLTSGGMFWILPAMIFLFFGLRRIVALRIKP